MNTNTGIWKVALAFGLVLLMATAAWSRPDSVTVVMQLFSETETQFGSPPQREMGPPSQPVFTVRMDEFIQLPNVTRWTHVLKLDVEGWIANRGASPFYFMILIGNPRLVAEMREQVLMAGVIQPGEDVHVENLLFEDWDLLLEDLILGVDRNIIARLLLISRDPIDFDFTGLSIRVMLGWY